MMTERVDHLVDILHGEYRELPGLNLTKAQMCRFLGVDSTTCEVVLDCLEREHFLTHTTADEYVLDRTEARPRAAHGSC